ncbi:MAG: DUF1146 family protein [Bacillaceae bacterium]
MEQEIAIQSATAIVSHLVFMGITWWALQAVYIDKFLRKNRVIQARALLIILTIVIGSALSNFFLDYMMYARQISGLFAG